jgi:hypothetical protein
MRYKAKVAACSEISTKYSRQREHHLEFFEAKNWCYVKKQLGEKAKILDTISL